VSFRGPVVRSEAFAAFWSGVLPLDDKRAVIHQYEAPIWRVFEAAGFRVGTAVPWEAHRLARNPAMDGWRVLLKLGCPFVKVQLLRDNPIPSNLDGWDAELRRRSYPVELVIDHLHRVRGPEAAAFKKN
jgi:lipopolysaccharide biosynthesis protein